MRHDTHTQPISQPPLASPQLGLFMEGTGDSSADAPPGLKLDEWLWRLPLAISNGNIRRWLDYWAAQQELPHYPRWVTLVCHQGIPHGLQRELRDYGLPTLILRPQPGYPLEMLTEHALQSGKSDIVIAPMPSANGQWLQRYNTAAARGNTRALLI